MLCSRGANELIIWPLHRTMASDDFNSNCWGWIFFWNRKKSHRKKQKKHPFQIFQFFFFFFFCEFFLLHHRIVPTSLDHNVAGQYGHPRSRGTPCLDATETQRIGRLGSVRLKWCFRWCQSYKTSCWFKMHSRPLWNEGLILKWSTLSPFDLLTLNRNPSSNCLKKRQTETCPIQPKVYLNHDRSSSRGSRWHPPWLREKVWGAECVLEAKIGVLWCFRCVSFWQCKV